MKAKWTLDADAVMPKDIYAYGTPSVEMTEEQAEARAKRSKQQNLQRDIIQLCLED